MSDDTYTRVINTATAPKAKSYDHGDGMASVESPTRRTVVSEPNVQQVPKGSPLGRMNVHGTVTGRWTTSKPNIEEVPPEQRRCPDDGRCFHQCVAPDFCWRRDRGGCVPLTASKLDDNWEPQDD